MAAAAKNTASTTTRLETLVERIVVRIDGSETSQVVTIPPSPEG